MTYCHGGDIYADDLIGESFDFSASINPFGISENVMNAALNAMQQCIHYPDNQCRALRNMIAQKQKLCIEKIFIGNGAADILYRLILALRPKKILLPAPTFYEYEQAAALIQCKIIRYFLNESNDFAFSEEFWEQDLSDIDLIILCNPNNPTGQTIPKWLMEKGMECCKKSGTRLLIDECFHDFLEEPEKTVMLEYVEDNPHLILLRSYTKMFAIPGIRLGYCLSSDIELLSSLYEMGAPWSVSVIAQACGLAAEKEIGFAERTREYISKQRLWLKTQLTRLGFYVVDGKANFLLCKNNIVPDLVQKLRKQGILIRDCRNFDGLDERWFRIAVRTEAENLVLISAMKQFIKEK